MEKERFGELVGGIYDAVVEPSLWTDAVDAIRREFRFHIALMGANKLPSGEVVINVSSNVPAPYVVNYGEYGADMLALWGGATALSRLPIEEPILHAPRLPPNWESNRYYLEWCKPQNLVDQVAIVLAYDRRTVAHIGLGIDGTRGPIETETMDELRLLAPHLRRAVQISRLLDMTTNAAATFEAALSAMGSGAVLVEADMKIVYANPTARRMLEQRDAIRSVAGRMELTTAIVPGQLELAVRAATGPEAQLGRRGMGIPTRGRDGSPAVLHVLPLAQRSPRTGAAWKTVAAVFVADTGGQATLPSDAIAVLFDLTPTETRVLEMTLDGHGTREVAERLEVAPSTIKTHMKSLFAKTGQHRREDLIKLARGVSLPG